MKVSVKYFGIVAEKTKNENEVVSLNLTHSVNLKKFFLDLYPNLESISFKIAVDHVIGEELSKGKVPKENALLPPFAGG